MKKNSVKIEKEFCITDNSVNVYKYRLLTEGLLLDEVKKNPIGYLMHDRDKGVVVRWEDFRVEGDKVFAKPVINLSHPEGEKIAGQIKNGFLNAASVGKITVLEISNDPKLKLKGQTRPTVTKWFPREISLVDIPGNYNAFANLYDAQDNLLNLSDLEQLNPIKNMNTPSDFLVKIATALNLSDHSENEILRYIEDLQDKASQAEGLKTKLSEVQEKLESLNEKVLSETVENLVAKGLKEKKLTVALAESLKKDYKTNPEGLEALIENMPVQYSAVGQLRRDIPEKYRGKTYRDLYVSGELEEVKEHFPALFESLKKQDHKNN